jgi:hypothetical protein
MKRLCHLVIATWALSCACQSVAASCHTENDKVALSGIIEVRTGTVIDKNTPYKYAILRLDRPTCYRSSEFGSVPRSDIVAILPRDTGPLSMPWKLVGKHVTLTGELEHSVTATQPPEKLLLFEPELISRGR